MLELLYERPELIRYPLPAPLAAVYPGPLGFSGPVLFANFVATLDGVADISGIEHVGHLLSGGSTADKMTVGLLRACADAVLVGAGTLRASPDSSWTPPAAYPPMARAYRDLRSQLSLRPIPELVVVTAGGNLNLSHPGLSSGALIATTEFGRSQLPGPLPDGVDLLVVGDVRVEWATLLSALEARGHHLLLSEAGPTTMGQLLDLGLVDELFLTVSPRLAGRPEGDCRPGLASGVSLLPGKVLGGELMTVQRAGSTLFLRYQFTGQAPRAGRG